jgi:hypothetical protein
MSRFPVCPLFVLAILVAAPIQAQGSASIIGSGCTDSNGRTAVLTTTSLPSIGNSAFSFQVLMGTGLANAWMFASFGQATTPLVLPGGGGCNVYLELSSMISLVQAGIIPIGPLLTSTAGSAMFPLPIPFDPSLAGATFYVQVAVEDPALTLGFTVSNALRVTIG